MIRQLSERFSVDGSSNKSVNNGYFRRFSRRQLGSIQKNDSDSSLGIIDDSGDDEDDGSSVYTTASVETLQTVEQENAKPFAAPNGGKRSSQLIVRSSCPRHDIEEARNDISKDSIYVKDVAVSKHVAVSFLALVRGDNKSWESMAVDILRQKARWSSIVFDGCSSASSISKAIEPDPDDSMADIGGIDDPDGDHTATHLDLLLSGIVNVDNCAFLHLTTLPWSLSTSFAMQSIVFSKSLTKLQLDFIDLSEHVPALATSLVGNKSITCLIASRCGLLDDHLGVLLRHLPRRIEELRVFGNKCRAKGLASLTDILQKKSRYRLQILDLSFQHVQFEEEFDISLFSEALGGNQSLKVLDLDNDSLDDKQLAHIVAALWRNKTLEEISLNHNKITGMGVAMLASKFGEMKGLKKISMYSNIFDKAPAGAS
mmetsp:Transcript_26533/g.62352  ORF Transcript_26533/g.62352 Transcript_26533/m.62352 type:complete len:428 (-) Transcript_26533:367-1650(-)